VIGSNEVRGRALLDQAANPNLRFLRADLSSIAEVERVVAGIAERHQAIDALALFANRLSPRYTETPEELEFTFALYYLSRYPTTVTGSEGPPRDLGGGRQHDGPGV
jgi:NAD(P)-dependent dehydrogenase (short-subunit alcohol dehydrogenase family)